MRSLAILMMAILAVPAIAAERKFNASPLELIEERLDDHDERISALEKLITPDVTPMVEKAESKPAEKIVNKAAEPVRYEQAEPRLKTSAELAQEIYATYRDLADRGQYRTFGRMASGQDHLVKTHLVNTRAHGFTREQVAGLSHNDALTLHNLDHRPGGKINPYTTTLLGETLATVRVIRAAPVRRAAAATAKVAAAPVVWATTPVVRAAQGSCANGQCARSSTSRQPSGWRPGRILFGR